MRQASSSQRRALAIAAAVLLLGVLAWQGHVLEHRLPQLERDVEALGAWAPLSYVAAVVVLAPLLVPDSIFGVVAGVVFGPVAGFTYYFCTVYVMSLLGYFVSRRWLRKPVLRMLEGRPSIRNMAAAASRQGPALTFWIRLVPLNPLLVSYALGALGVPIRSVAIGTLGMFPHMFLTVYLGVSAVHVTRMATGRHEHWSAEGFAMLGGLVVCAAVVLAISRRAWRKVEENVSTTADAS